MKWLKNISENLVAKAASPLAEEGLVDKDVVKQAVVYNDPEARKQIEDSHKVAYTGSIIGAALTFPATRKLATKIITHPITEAVGTVTGLHNLVTDQGIEKTVDHAKEGKYGKMVLSAIGDILDASPIVGGIKGVVTGAKALKAGQPIVKALKTTVENLPVLKFKRIFSKENRAKHAYATINPFGYHQPIKRGVKWVSSLLADRPVDINAVKIDWFGDITAWDRFHNLNREDAWRIYNGLPQKNNTYVKNLDGSYRINLEEVMKRYPSKELSITPNFGADEFNKWGYDEIIGNHGGLTYRHTTDIDDYGRQLHVIEDDWDLHPFRDYGDSFSQRYLALPSYNIKHASHKIYMSLYDKLEKISTFLQKLGIPERKAWDIEYKISKLLPMRTLDKIASMDEISFPKLDKWLSNIEAGQIIGGTPFKMRTKIPTKLIWRGVGVPRMIYDTEPYYPIAKESFSSKHFDELKDINIGSIINPEK